MKPWSSMRIRPSVLQQCAREAADLYGVRPEDVLGESRRKPVAHARQWAMWSLRQVKKPDGEAAYASTEIGRAFKRDHSTVFHAIERVEQRMRGEA